jgi:hypothetical protein
MAAGGRMTQAGDQPAKHGRSLTGFYIAIGVVAVLFGLGVALYRPLRLRYAAHLVQSAARREAPVVDAHWVVECADAACRGNRLGMEAVIDASGTCWTEDETCYDLAYRVAKAQPGEFYEVLGRRPDKQVLRVLADIANACTTVDAGGDLYGIEWPSVSALDKYLVDFSKSREPEARRVAQAAHEFVRRRFAKELAEAQEAKREAHKP